MTHFRVLTTTLLAAALLAAPAMSFAQSGDAAMTPAERHDWERSHRISKIIGSDVRNKAGEKIGDIRDLMIDNNGVIKLAIVSTGGFLPHPDSGRTVRHGRITARQSPHNAAVCSPSAGSRGLMRPGSS